MHLLGVAGLLLLAFSGPFSGVPALTAVPNPILIGALVASAAVAARPRGEPVPFRALGPVALLLIALLVPAGFFIDASSVYATEKLLHLVTLVPLSVLAGATILQHPRARQLWLCGVVSVGTLMAVLGFLFPDAAVASAGRGWAVQGSNAIAAGLLTGAATLVLLAVGLHRRWDGILLLGAATPFLTLTVAAGSRGPLAALLVAALVVLYVTGAGRARVFCVTLAAGVVVAWLAG